MGVADWPVIAGAVGTLLATIFIAVRGWTDKKTADPNATHQIIAGTIQDNRSMHDNTDELKRMNRNLEDLHDVVRTNTAALTRLIDVSLFRRD